MSPVLRQAERLRRRARLDAIALSWFSKTLSALVEVQQVRVEIDSINAFENPVVIRVD
jgi:hypothetical protein